MERVPGRIFSERTALEAVAFKMVDERVNAVHGFARAR
jgi:hypothetical protein